MSSWNRWNGLSVNFTGVMAIAAAFAPTGVAQAVPATRPAAAQTQPAGPAPKIHCEKPIYEFPDAWGGEKVEHTFIIRNDGNATLKIPPGGVKPSCGCTVAGKYDETIEPGKEGKIPVALNTARQNVPILKTIHVQSNDPITPDLTLTLKGNIKMRIGMEPVIGAAWGRIGPQSPDSKTIKLTNSTRTPMKLQPIPLSEAEQKMFAFTLKEIEPGKAAEVVVSLKKPVKEGSSFANLRFNTGITEEPEVTIPCNAFVAPAGEPNQPVQQPVAQKPTTFPARATGRRVEVSPAEVTVNAGDRLQRSVVAILNHGAKKLNVLSVKSSNDRVRTQFYPEVDGKSYKLLLSIPPISDQDRYKATGPDQVTIRTDDAEFGEIVIPIRVSAVQVKPTDKLSRSH